MTHYRLYLALMLTLVACGGGGIDTGDIGGDELLEELEPQQSESLCRATTSYAADKIGAQEIREFNCYIAGLSAGLVPINIGGGDDGMMPLTCEDVYQRCLAGEGQIESSASVFDADECDEQDDTFEDCDATVDELVACSEDAIDQLDELIDTVNCQSGLLSLVSAANLYTSEACSTVQRKCPDLFGADGDDADSSTSASATRP